MKIRVLFFSILKERTKVPQAEIDFLPGATVSDLLNEIGMRFPTAVPILNHCIVAINQKYSSLEEEIPDGAEVALFPPVSGGTGNYPTICSVTHDALDLNEIVERINGPTIGAVCTFTGIVRGQTSRGEIHDTAMLEYEAYVPMAEAKMLQIAGEIRMRWADIEGIVIVQRIGQLAPGIPTVVIAVSAGHRDTGIFEAARYGIDRLKEIVPVWKKEISANGEVWVEGDYHPKPGE